MESVTFTPHYTLRASSSGTESSLTIRYHARISNTSGEDWNDVSLAISTAQASETTVIPNLMRWTLDFYNRNANWNVVVTKGATKKRSVGVSMPQMNVGTVLQQQQYGQRRERSNSLGGPPGYGLDDIEGGALDMVTAAAEVSEGITSTFIIPGKQTIKDGEKNHTVVIRDLVLEGKFANICVPKIKDVAYLQVPFLIEHNL